ncbi:acyl-CoA-binding protein (ACBP)/diazepam binding inhibitor (DBI)/endozepine (EP) [Metarhizium acridum]|uniref:acyl-CoA-binding protein (ACBP)/diazepam binding inhibitor (DBI)/endozepine (EP) n=1 Tax=Metarhizium acridum TaxID=92637 RepID=UPI001C6BB681|nr:acyl-CoA-binding protein (ACBP)/diazepam binding inhibitor (DBI)/endozepine (EP) [Metarhizium acridum]KAG8425228.1 acyl-CoA-binding protein (ACBP)/diazepam binding inhibitor (DBI)/endozepine (EP) [Metarhizium acridum]
MSVNTSNQAFNDAANIEAQKLKGHLSQDDMLRLYSFFKIAKGDDITTEAAPGMFDLARKKMRASWKARVDEGVTVEEAQKKYIELVEELKKDKQIQ